MPIYEFSCPKCGCETDELVPMDTEHIECPACGESMQKGISAPNFHLKGHFWYKDGYGLRQNKKKKEPKKNG